MIPGALQRSSSKYRFCCSHCDAKGSQCAVQYYHIIHEADYRNIIVNDVNIIIEISLCPWAIFLLSGSS